MRLLRLLLVMLLVGSIVCFFAEISKTSETSSSQTNGFKESINSSSDYKKSDVKFGSPDQAQLLVYQAVKYLNEVGIEKAFKAFNDGKSHFIYKDLYIFIFDLNGNVVAHGQNNKLIGTNRYELKDADGKLFIAEMVRVAKKFKSGWVDYKWLSTISNEEEAKTSYIELYEGKYVIGCGAYRYKN